MFKGSVRFNDSLMQEYAYKYVNDHLVEFE